MWEELFVWVRAFTSFVFILWFFILFHFIFFMVLLTILFCLNFMMNTVIMWLFCKYLFVCCFYVCVNSLSLSFSVCLSLFLAHIAFSFYFIDIKLSFYFCTWMKWNWFLCMDFSPLIYINMRMWFFHEIILVWIYVINFFFLYKRREKKQIKRSKEFQKERKKN